ncbi:MAG: hypothetical protein IJL69_02820 [Oscillospiraceae bacterium]|nr:hypothetical protein [Oscillospiraceae bacterium]
MTERERFIRTLRREPIGGRVPTFELVFYLTMEAFGKVHPDHRSYHQWKQMSAREKQAHIDDEADLFIDTARRFHHSAIFVHANPYDMDTRIRLYETIREKSGDEFFLMAHGDPTFAMPDGNDMLDFTARLYEEPEDVHAEARRNLDRCLAEAEELDRRGHLLDGFALCSDYCFNVNPFFTPDMFAEFIAPYLKASLDAYRALGFYSIKHTDGNIMPIVDQMVQCGPDAIHSLDPQGGVDLGEVSRLYGDKVALIGNVNCGLLQTGTDEEVAADVRRALRQGMARGAGYVFATSNCVYTGMSLARYALMQDIWWREGIYPGPEAR